MKERIKNFKTINKIFVIVGIVIFLSAFTAIGKDIKSAVLTFVVGAGLIVAGFFIKSKDKKADRPQQFQQPQPQQPYQPQPYQPQYAPQPAPAPAPAQPPQKKTTFPEDLPLLLDKENYRKYQYTKVFINVVPSLPEKLEAGEFLDCRKDGMLVMSDGSEVGTISNEKLAKMTLDWENKDTESVIVVTRYENGIVEVSLAFYVDPKPYIGKKFTVTIKDHCYFSEGDPMGYDYNYEKERYELEEGILAPKSMNEYFEDHPRCKVYFIDSEYTDSDKEKLLFYAFDE